MTYVLQSEDGYVGDLASIGGYADMYDAVNNNSAAGSLLREFFENGCTNHPRQAAEAIDRFLASNKRPLRPGVISTFRNLRKLLLKCGRGRIAMVTD
jgi:hypothetical protein